MNRTERIIENQYMQYLKLKSEYDNESNWIHDIGYYIIKNPQKSNQWFALIIGPDESIYTGSLMIVRLTFLDDYPFSPPKIENLMPFKRQFNSNLWSSDTVQNLIGQDGEYRPFYGLICMDILNTPHSKITIDAYGNAVEVYDKSKELYTPILGIGSILLSMRSNILNGETRMAHINDQTLKQLCLRSLAFGVFNKEFQLPETDKQFLISALKPLLENIYKMYRSHYEKVIKETTNPEAVSEMTELLSKFDLIGF